MEMLSREEIEKDYNNIKSEFQKEDKLLVAHRIASQMGEQEEIFKEVFSLLLSAFKGKLRNDGKTPLVFHSIYLTKLLYYCGEKELDSLLTGALHDVLEDTKISEEILGEKWFMFGRRHILNNLRILKENKNLSREPDGKNLPPRYVEHIRRIIGASREVINTEILDRFSDLMDLEYITELPKEEKEMRLISKLIKVRSFVSNITRDRTDFNKNCINLFWSKVEALENQWKIKVEAPVIKK